LVENCGTPLPFRPVKYFGVQAKLPLEL